MKHILKVLIFLPLALLAQINSVDKLMMAGNQAFQRNDLETAKNNFISVLKLEPKNKDANYNLAAIFLNEGDTVEGCSYLQNLYKLMGKDSFQLIKTYCNGQVESLKMFRDHVESQPKFKNADTDKFEPIYILDGTINPTKGYLNPAFKKAIKNKLNLKILANDYQGDLFVLLRIKIDGSVDIDISDQFTPQQKESVEKEFTNLTIYQPAQYKGRDVELFQGIPIKLEVN